MAISAGTSQRPRGAPHVYAHANGLQLSVSEIYEVKTTPVGFVIQLPHSDKRRNPFTVSVQLLPTPPNVRGYRLRYLGPERLLQYKVTHEDEGGSSGVNWTVVAYEHVGNRWIEYFEDKLSEDEPVELWKIAEGLR